MKKNCFIQGFILICLFLLNLTSHAQTEGHPKVGDRCPEFMLNDLHYYPRKTASSRDFSGKPMILDFFSVGCSSCFESFPHLNELKKEFEGKIQFMLVAKKSTGLQEQYEKYRKHYHLDLPLDYDDSTIWNQFGVLQVPYSLWIDTAGIIRQISTAAGLNQDRLEKFLRGEKQTLLSGATQDDLKNVLEGNEFYDVKKPFLINGNGGPDTSYSYRSILVYWNPASSYRRDLFLSSQNKNHVDEIGVSPQILYMLAYGDTINTLYPPSPDYPIDNLGQPNHYGQWANKPVIESLRRDLFYNSMDSTTNIYSYSLTIPDSLSNALNLQQIMRNDLKNYFHFDVKTEIRKWPCWKIVADKNSVNKLETKGGESFTHGDFYTITFRNRPVSSLLVAIWGYNQRDSAIFIDGTGINSNIDLTMNCVWTDLNDIKRELNKNGLDIIKTETEVRAVVIRDEEKGK